MMKIDIDYVESFDGLKLFVRRFHSDEENSSRTLLITHGLSEHSGRYEHVGMVLAEQGWNVLIPDLRGHGQSEGARMHANRFDDFCNDLNSIRRHYELSPEELVMIGHSLGGLISIRDAQTHPEARSRLVLLSPFLGMIRKPPVWKWYSGRLLSVVAPRTLFATGIKPEEATSNPIAAAQRAFDPYNSEQISARLFFECQRAIQNAWVELNRIQVPTLVYQSEVDTLVNAAATISWLKELQRIAPAPCEGKLFPEHKHELLNEPDWQQTCHSILNWIEQPLQAVPAEA
ncbi:MAG: lysophospholipase [Planctomycetaceae bacterium]|nr:lysophospholipase [Planctomycetaceae bacterium]